LYDEFDFGSYRFDVTFTFRGIEVFFVVIFLQNGLYENDRARDYINYRRHKDIQFLFETFLYIVSV